MRDRPDPARLLVAAILAGGCYVAPWTPGEPRLDSATAAGSSTLVASPCEPERPSPCDDLLGPHASPVPRGAWEACRRPT